MLADKLVSLTSIPQEAVLGSLIFTLHISDLEVLGDSTYLLARYADDQTLPAKFEKAAISSYCAFHLIVKLKMYTCGVG